MHICNGKLTINVLLILKVREIFFRGVKKVEAPQKSPKLPHYMFCPRQKNNPLHFLNQRYIGILMSLREIARQRESERESERERELAREREREREQEQEQEQVREQETESKRKKRKRERERQRRSVRSLYSKFCHSYQRETASILLGSVR
jgi:hypothetical protein